MEHVIVFRGKCFTQSISIGELEELEVNYLTRDSGSKF